MTVRDPETGTVQSALRRFQKLRNFDGGQGEYWKEYLLALMDVSQARAGLIAVKSNVDPTGWRTLAALPDDPAAQDGALRLSRRTAALAQQCVPKGYALAPAEGGMVLAVNVLIETDPHACVALLLVDRLDPREARESVEALVSLNDLPGQYRLQQSAFEALKNQNRLADILDLLVMINGQSRFVAASMTVCNELASRYGCDRVSLGWVSKGYIKVAAMSHTDQFEKKMSAVQALEQAMEEVVDQETEIVLPAAGQDKAAPGPVARDCEAYAKAVDARFVAALPVRSGDSILAVAVLERPTQPFTESELRHLRIMLDQSSSRLKDIRHRDRWFGPRVADWARDRIGKLLGYKHTWAKLLAVAVSAILLFAGLVPVSYRVDSPMILRTDDITYVTAPFDGYIDSVGVRAGDPVKIGQALLALDTKDLQLEQAGLMAERNRQEREMEKARAAGDLAEMLIAQARYDQAVARLDINMFKIGQAAIVAPYDGVVIEGDLREKVGSPVKVGEILFKVGRITEIYAEAKVSESEIRNVRDSAGGRIALASRPQDRFPVRVELIEPAAVPAAGDNAFNVRCRFEGPVPEWFRPGMTGVSKIDAGRRTLFWIVSHRTIDFLRLKLWW